jgi:hypothetical protein
MFVLRKMSAETSRSSANGTGPARERVLPDPAICRARVLSEDLPDCLVDNPTSCPYAYSVGTRCFCTHPKWAEIVTRTEASDTHTPGPDWRAAA